MSISGMIQPEEEPTSDVVELKEVESVVEPVVQVTPDTEPEPPAQPKSVLDVLLDRIQPIDKRKKYLKVLIYSQPGAGKTTLMGGAPNNFIMDVEDGLTSLDSHPELVADNVQTMPYKNFGALELVIDQFMTRPEQLAHFETFSIDSLSELHKRGLQEVTEREYAKSPGLKNRYVAETEEHTENNEHIRRLTSSLRDLPMNLILTAHARTIEPKGQMARIFPDFSEKMANTISGIMDIVGYMYLKEIDGEVKRVMRVHSDGIVAAKTRIGGLPDEIIDPTWDKLWDAFQTHNRK